jgi:hypothetical protein
MEPTAYLEINAGNDVNGNPRRAAVIYELTPNEDGSGAVAMLLDVIDEGYEGYPRWVRSLAYLGSFRVSVKEYKAYLKRAAVPA